MNTAHKVVPAAVRAPLRPLCGLPRRGRGSLRRGIGCDSRAGASVLQAGADGLGFKALKPHSHSDSGQACDSVEISGSSRPLTIPALTHTYTQTQIHTHAHTVTEKAH